ncbi:UDP-N-acetylglucosamine 4-epimerase [Clostridium amylolyticum]|uniref:UDP-N-acetylglucosamine 4-epimerase n=1 Tax=Clostridium amylolyticum TaxID=1121298 RepID=A0A1M6NS22_9CLOT|nr:NAD-dependent epimerase/dehydratase family protein [Clostridium amylolyticum]SHJ98519.1 UDP-N-acetylglucosamine 4-epimerase [Clostridium amylolyticum]
MNIESEKENYNTRFLVTGGAGFIGSNLVEELLKKGYKVRVLDNFSTGKMENIKEFLSSENFQLIEGDIRDLKKCRECCEDVDFILHQAAWGSVPRSIKEPLLYEDINIKGTLNLFKAALDNKVKRVVYASSSSVYGNSSIIPKREGEEGRVLSPYALTKRANEEYARLFYELYGLESIGLRYFNVFGKKQDSHSSYAAVIPKFITALWEDERPIIYGDGNQYRDFTAVENVIQANIKASTAPSSACGKVFNIACGDNITINELLKSISLIMHKPFNPIYQAERQGDVLYSKGDIHKAKEYIGYEPLVDVSTGLKSTIKWYETQLTMR